MEQTKFDGRCFYIMGMFWFSVMNTPFLLCCLSGNREQHFMMRAYIYFNGFVQEDNMPYNTGNWKYCSRMIRKIHQGIAEVSLASNSLDLNPVAHLSDVRDKRVRSNFFASSRHYEQIDSNSSGKKGKKTTYPCICLALPTSQPGYKQTIQLCKAEITFLPGFNERPYQLCVWHWIKHSHRLVIKY